MMVSLGRAAFWWEAARFVGMAEKQALLADGQRFPGGSIQFGLTGKT